MYVLVNVDKFKKWIVKKTKITFTSDSTYLEILSTLDSYDTTTQRKILGLNFHSTVYSTKEILECVENNYDTLETIQSLGHRTYQLSYIVNELSVVMSKKPYINENITKHVPFNYVLSAMIETVREHMSDFEKHLQEKIDDIDVAKEIYETV